jgi:hypothetical protein
MRAERRLFETPLRHARPGSLTATRRPTGKNRAASRRRRPVLRVYLLPLLGSKLDAISNEDVQRLTHHLGLNNVLTVLTIAGEASRSSQRAVRSAFAKATAASLHLHS